MKTLTITEARALLQKLTAHAIETNRENAEQGLRMEQYRICAKCGEVTTAEFCICAKQVH